MRKRLLYVATTAAVFPQGIACSSRIVNLARLFDECGYDVHIIADFTYEDFKSSSEIKRYENCTYQAVNGKNSRIKRYVNAYVSLRVIDTYLSNNHVDIVVAGSCYDRFNGVKKICDEYKLPLVLEITEWYGAFKFGNWNPLYRKFKNCMQRDYMQADKFIAISTLLYKHFAATGKEILRIPTIVDTKALPASLDTNNEKIHITYAGFSGRNKETFTEILEALELLGDKRDLFELSVYGCSEAAFINNLGNKRDAFERVRAVVSVKGRVPQNRIHQIYSEADYSIFIRPDKHSNHAGFPTKLAESLTAGTPVICNNTGDIGLYLNNGVNGFLVEEVSVKKIQEVLERIVILTAHEKHRMREQARLTAEKSFDYRRYTETMESFLAVLF